ncbi:MAG: aspartate aminotransferase family protein [Acidimicrobiales bacterium]|nr:aspartate aminotransferase family protein [Acidimicrobiales bacterium]
MMRSWPEFDTNPEGLATALEYLIASRSEETAKLPDGLPGEGMGEKEALELLAPIILDGARPLGAPGFFAHMDPPTPWITWAVQQWTASRNQNLLHADTATTARALESNVVDWIAPIFGMGGGHMTPGSTVANLTALWAAREAGASEVVATADAHLSIKKAAHILGLPIRQVRWESARDLTGAAAVITAGTTSTGTIEPLDAAAGAMWRHVDAAWAGPLLLSERHAHLLDGIERADSVAVSAHKWLFQPKESALVLFAHQDEAHRSISVGGAYLSEPNVGVLGSHGASAAPLAATLLAYGKQGIARWIDHSMALAEQLHHIVCTHAELEARSSPQSGVLNWRHVQVGAEEILAELPKSVFVSATTIDGEQWLRSVAANPNADPEFVVAGVLAAADQAASAKKRSR